MLAKKHGARPLDRVSSFVPMTKFSSFLVYTFGVALIGFLVFTIVRTNFFPPPPPPVEERTIITKSGLAPLEVGTREQFSGQLDQL